MQQPSECCSDDASLCSAAGPLVAASLSWCCPWCWREQKHQSRSPSPPPPPRFFSTRRGQGPKGEVPCVYLIQLGSQWSLPRDRAAKKGAAGLSNKDIQPKPLPRLNPPHYSAEWGSIVSNADLTQLSQAWTHQKAGERKIDTKISKLLFSSIGPG